MITLTASAHCRPVRLVGIGRPGQRGQAGRSAHPQDTPPDSYRGRTGVMMVIMDEANRTPRCTMPGCPVRYRSGSDRPCRGHLDDGDPGERAARLGVLMLAVPGDDDDDGQPLLRRVGGWVLSVADGEYPRPPC